MINSSDMSELFASYRLLERLDSGSIGEVFLAEDTLGQRVALKRLLVENNQNAALRELFQNECSIAKTLSHPNILGALECGEEQNRPFFTMQLVTGDKLAPQEALPAIHYRRFFADMARALDYMHDAGWLHLDLSPSNILASDPTKNTWMLGDFSATSKLGEPQSSVRGTYAYMSPEQAKGGVLDQRSDIFSLATLCWEVLNSERLFARQAPHLSLRAVVEDPIPQSPDLAESVTAVLGRALSKERSLRPMSAGAFIAELLQALD